MILPEALHPLDNHVKPQTSDGMRCSKLKSLILPLALRDFLPTHRSCQDLRYEGSREGFS